MTDTTEQTNPFSKDESEVQEIIENERDVFESAVAEKEKVEEKPQPNQAAMLIPIGADGRVVARNNSELMRYCGALVNGGGVPQRFNTPQKLFAALMFARDLKLPDTAIRQIAEIEGTMTIFGDLPLSLAQRTKEMTFFKEVWFDKDYNELTFENKNLTNPVFGAVCVIQRGTLEKQSFSFTLEEAAVAGLYPCKNEKKPWAKYPKMMLRYRARSIALKSVFADAINGASIAEYDFDLLPSVDADERDVTPPTPADTINERFLKREQA
jgi:hypothetical protein